MKRWLWVLPLLVAAAALAQNVVFDPTSTLQRRSQKAAAQFDGEMSFAERKAQLGLELAAEERRLNLRNAEHERATSLWLAAEAYRQSPRDPGARQAYIQATAQTNQQFMQAMSQVFQAWSQQVSQTLQTCMQEGNGALQAGNTELNAAWQSFAQTMPNFDKEVGEVMLDDLQPAAQAQQATDASKALETALKAARDKYAAAQKEATAAWAQAAQQCLVAFRNRQLAEELAVAQLRKANRVWLTTMTDALDELRSSSRAALRKYQFAAVPD